MDRKSNGLYDPKYEHDACGMGFVANKKGHKSRKIIDQALEVLVNMSHRGATGSEEETGDGAGILLQIPHNFFKKEMKKKNVILPLAGEYGVGMLFLPRKRSVRKKIFSLIKKKIKAEGLSLLGWRRVKQNRDLIGQQASDCCPEMFQVFVSRPENLSDKKYEIKLFVLTRLLEQAVFDLEFKESFYIASFSHKTVVYKGMLKPGQLEDFYPDLQDSSMTSSLALIHSRFSTNTFPSWERAHPNRYLIHNGEINTLQGNINWMRARESLLESELLGEDIKKLMPIIRPGGSDSAMMDNCLQFLHLAGYSLPRAIMMMIPEPWVNNKFMDQKKKDFYNFHSCIMEPWDGPAAVAFTDGVKIGAVLDRNGLRPARYYVTSDDLVVMASEVGVLNLESSSIISKQRLEPGKMLFVDTRQGRIIKDEELKQRIAQQQPYGKWLQKNLIHINELSEKKNQCVQDSKDNKNNRDKDNRANSNLDHKKSNCVKNTSQKEINNLLKKQKMYGYTFEELRKILAPMAQKGIDPTGSMGYDASLAVLSEKPQLLYNYFHQLFAQVTNPPIDSIREKIITSTMSNLGSEGNLLNPKPEDCRRIRIESPILTNKELIDIKNLNSRGLKSAVFSIAACEKKLKNDPQEVLNELFLQVDRKVKKGVNLLILSDRKMKDKQWPLPSLLAAAGLHHHLIKNGNRTRVSIVLESGEPRTVHHFSVLLGYGLDAINPYLGYKSIQDIWERDMLEGLDIKTAVNKYRKAAVKGIVKVMAKMGISTVQSYRGAQIFEAVGLENKLINKYFPGTVSKIEGMGLKDIMRETLDRYQKSSRKSMSGTYILKSGSSFNWRKGGEKHLFNPETIYLLQQACRNNDYNKYKKFAEKIDNHYSRRISLRGQLEFKGKNEEVPLREVEAVENRCSRFKTGAMSYGSISQEAHEALAIAMNRIGGKSNTGEGGEDENRYTRDKNGDLRCSAIKQVASGRFGVDSLYLKNAQELQIKMAQGAKPGEGGQLPGKKVYPWIAEVRGTTPGVGLISPPPHHDIYSIEDLAELIYDLKNANSGARINVKLVSKSGVGTIAAGVAKGKADVILISGYDGGTGASPRTSIRHAGLPWELGVAETHQTLVKNNLRSRVRIETDGKLLTGKDLAVAALLGAEEYGFSTAPLITLGCVMMRVCSKDTCPVGVATQNPELRKEFKGKPEYVVNFMKFAAQNLREKMAELGFRTVDEMIGRVDRLQQKKQKEYWKLSNLDLSPLLFQPALENQSMRYCTEKQKHELADTMDNKKLVELARPALEQEKKVQYEFNINNKDRATGTILGGKITEKYGARGLPEDTIEFHFYGSAGQSFGAFIPGGLTMKLTGDTNDYLGKGLSGGKIIVKPPENISFIPEKNIITGNVAFLGATSGQAFIRGKAGERFCVRNSGLQAVVEGAGDHACEYMTGGRVIVLGETGINFAAGMTGGIAYVADVNNDFHDKCNRDMISLEAVTLKDEIKFIKNMINRHIEYTDSSYARNILKLWKEKKLDFIKVLPDDYRRMLKTIEKFKNDGLTNQQAMMAAFKENNQLEIRGTGN